jgi:hypothetical protein
MCIFCAAIPAALAVGVKAHSEQHKQLQSAKEQGLEPPKLKIPAKTATGLVVAGLVAGSILYHTGSGG